MQVQTPSLNAADADAADRRLRDVIALSTLPAVWHGADLNRIAESLAAALFTVLDPEFVLVSFTRSGEPPVAVAQTGRYEQNAALAEALVPRITDWIRQNDNDEPLLLKSPSGGGSVNVVTCAIGHHAELGVIAAAFPAGASLPPLNRLLMNVAATQAATAIQNTDLMRSLQESEKRLRQDAQALTALHRVSTSLAAELDLDTLVQKVTDAGTELSGAQFGAFFYNKVDDRGESYTLYTLSGAPREAFSKFPMPRNTSVFGPTFRGEGVIRVADITADPRYGKNPPYHGMPPGHLPVRSYLAVPVVARSGEVIGGLFFGHSEPGVFTEEAERLVSGIAAQAAIAIDNARLFARAEREIEQRRRTEQALHDASARLEAALKVAAMGTWVWEITENRLFADKNLAELFSVSEEYTAGGPLEPYVAAIHPEDRDRVLQILSETVEAGSTYEADYRVVTKNGGVRWLTARGRVERDEQGRALRMLGAVVDVTERKEAEEQFRVMADNIPQLAWMAHADGNVFWYNRRWYEYTGTSPESPKGWGWQSVHDPQQLPAVLQGWKHSLATGKPFDMVFPLRRSDGSFRPFLTRVMPVKDEAGRIVKWFGTNTDITEWQKAEEALRRSEERLKSLNATLEQRVGERTMELERTAARLRRLAADLAHAEQRERKRLAAMLHDHLQQLLVAAKMRISGALSADPPAECREELAAASGFIDDSIQSSRSLTVELRPPVLYEDGLGPALRWLGRWMGQQHGLEVSVDICTGVEPAQDQVRGLLFEAVRELLFNIVKHAEVRSARVTMELDGESLLITVADEGRGIDSSQAPPSPDGTRGFGMYSIRERLAALGGAMEVDSAPGAGTRVKLIAPVGRDLLAATPDDQEAPAPEPEVGEPAIASAHEVGSTVVRVLLVDDHKIVREGIANLLSQERRLRIIAQAADGQEGVDKARELMPDVVIMDVNMPRMNGVDATRIISRDLPQVKVIGLSVQGDEEIAESMRSAGAVAYVNKAGDPARLIEAVLSCCGVPEN